MTCATLSLLLAQGDSLAGNSGWVGAGLLGIVLWWLMFKHLPAKDTQLKEFMDAKDKQLKEFSDANDAHVEKMTAKFEAMMTLNFEHCRQDVDQMRQSHADFRLPPKQFPDSHNPPTK